MPSSISSDVAEDAKQLFDQKNKREFFNNDQYDLCSTKTFIVSNYFGFYKNKVIKCKKREYPNYSAYGVCGHTLAVSAYSSSLTLFLQSLQKDRRIFDLLELSNFGNPNGSGTKKGYKRV